ncbi:hypothetical protein D9M68_925160 [compost metagenome]
MQQAAEDVPPQIVGTQGKLQAERAEVTVADHGVGIVGREQGPGDGHQRPEGHDQQTDDAADRQRELAPAGPQRLVRSILLQGVILAAADARFR